MSKLSFSRATKAINCGLQYHLHYIEQVPVLTKTPIYFITGSAVHEAVEQWAESGFHKGTLTSLTLNRYKYLLSNESSKYIDADAKIPMLKQAASNTEVLYRNLGLTERGEIEYQINAEVSGIECTGIIDAYDPGNRAIYDLKISSSEKYVPDPKQLYLYAHLLRAAGLECNRVGFLFPLRPEKIQLFEIEGKHLDNAELFIRIAAKRIKAIEAGDYDARTGRHCYSCVYNETVYCPATNGDELISKWES